MRSQPKVFNLTFLMYRHPDAGGHFVAHCLEMDVVAVGSNRPRAISLLKELIEEAVVSAYHDGTQDTLMHPAPPEYWALLARAKSYSPPTPAPSRKAKAYRDWRRSIGVNYAVTQAEPAPVAVAL